MYLYLIETELQCEFVKFHSKGAVRIVELNRPAALHALNAGMVEAILGALQVFQLFHLEMCVGVGK
jgi:hypothetical protein